MNEAKNVRKRPVTIQEARQAVSTQLIATGIVNTVKQVMRDHGNDEEADAVIVAGIMAATDALKADYEYLSDLLQIMTLVKSKLKNVQ